MEQENQHIQQDKQPEKPQKQPFFKKTVNYLIIGVILVGSLIIVEAFKVLTRKEPVPSVTKKERGGIAFAGTRWGAMPEEYPWLKYIRSTKNSTVYRDTRKTFFGEVEPKEILYIFDERGLCRVFIKANSLEYPELLKECQSRYGIPLLTGKNIAHTKGMTHRWLTPIMDIQVGNNYGDGLSKEYIACVLLSYKEYFVK